MNYLMWYVGGHPDEVGFVAMTGDVLRHGGETPTTLVLADATTFSLTDAMKARATLNHFGHATIVAVLE